MDDAKPSHRSDTVRSLPATLPGPGPHPLLSAPSASSALRYPHPPLRCPSPPSMAGSYDRCPTYSVTISNGRGGADDGFPFHVFDEFNGMSGTKSRSDKESEDCECYVILTCRSLAWTLLTLVSTALVVGSVITPYWLVGTASPSPDLHTTLVASSNTRRTLVPGITFQNDSDHPASLVRSLSSTPSQPLTTTSSPTRRMPPGPGSASIGLFNHCQWQTQNGNGTVGEELRWAAFWLGDPACEVYVTGFDMSGDDFPDTWKAGLLLFGLAALLLAFTCLTAILSLCVQALCRKSIFTVSGLLQSLAALFLVIGLVVYPGSWGARRVKQLCGKKAGAFRLDHCQIGWAYLACIGGTVLVFLCALLSIQAEAATSSEKVERKIERGRHCVCTI